MINVQEIVFHHIAKLRRKGWVKPIENDNLLGIDFGLNSMDLILLFTRISEALDLELMDFDDTDLSGIKTVSQLVSLFNKQLNNLSS